MGLSAMFSPVFANDRSIELTVLHGAGGVSDLTSRYIASNLKNRYIVVNRPGANGRIAISHLLKKDTLMMVNIVPIYVINPMTVRDLEYNPLTDFEVIAVVGIMPSALVCIKNTGFKTFYDFLKSSQRLSFGIGGFGSNEHLATEALANETTLKVTMVPYPQGGSKSVVELVGGHIDCMFANYPTIKSFISNENLILLMTSHKLGYDVVTWQDVYKREFPFQSYQLMIVPERMDSKIKEQISLDFINAFSNLRFKQGIAELGLFPVLETDKKKIARTVTYASDIQKFIIEKNIKIGD
jgi:tripartite-type tricarboxylate transporter receptor subunit TctC